MFVREELEAAKRKNADLQHQDANLQRVATQLVNESFKHDYAYQWTWLGMPVIQMPADIVAVQELIWQTKPDLIVETGIAWGGSVVLYASILQLIGKGEVVAIDLNLMDHVAAQIKSYPFSDRISVYRGSSTDPAIVAKVADHAAGGKSVMVILDSDHSHEHVLNELKAYAPMVTKDSYLIVTDTVIEDLEGLPHRPRNWGPGRSPKSAMDEYLKTTDRFVSDDYVNRKVLTTFSPGGYLRCVK